MLEFTQVISSESELRDLLGHPSQLVKNKIIDHLDQHCQDFISKSPMIFISTSDSKGKCDVSPRGDAPGFVFILDEHHIIIPERPGNRRMDSLKNILSNPYIGLIFIIPGLEETLRVNGKATLIKDETYLKKMEAKGSIPKIAIAVEVEESFIHCAKAFKRSELWQPNKWLDESILPQPAKILSAHAKLPNMGVEEIEKALNESYSKRLY